MGVSRTSDLYDLQMVDLELAARRAALAEIDARLEGNPVLDDLRARLDAEREQLTAIQAEQRDVDLRTREARERVGAAETKLYGGSVVDARELGHLQASLEQDQAALRRDEDALLLVMTRAETVQATVQELEEEIAELETGWAAERAQLEAQREELAAQMGSIEARRASVAARVRRDDLQTYNMLAARLAGRAVAKVQRGACQECHISLPTVVVQRARRGEELATCSSCQRILYVG